MGGFQHQPRQGNQVAQVDSDKLLLYNVSSCEIVLHNGKLESLGDLLFQKQTEKGKASICYHDVSVKAGTEANQFDIIRKHDVYFKAAAKVAGEEEGTELKLNKGTRSFAALVPFTTVSSLKHAKVLWSVKWALKGLMPIKPHLCIFDEMGFDGGKAVKLWGLNSVELISWVFLWLHCAMLLAGQQLKSERITLWSWSSVVLYRCNMMPCYLEAAHSEILKLWALHRAALVPKIACPHTECSCNRQCPCNTYGL